MKIHRIIVSERADIIVNEIRSLKKSFRYTRESCIMMIHMLIKTKKIYGYYLTCSFVQTNLDIISFQVTQGFQSKVLKNNHSFMVSLSNSLNFIAIFLLKKFKELERYHK